MLRRFGTLLRRQSIGVIALVIVLSSGTAYAASAMWTGANIVDGSLTGADIKSGSITSTQLAPGAGLTGGSGQQRTRIDWSVPSGTVDWSTSNPDGNITTIATKTVNVPTDGFVTYQFGSTLAFSENAGCGPGRTQPTFELRATIDGSSTHAAVIEEQAQGDNRSLPFGIGSVYLKAGPHTMNVTGRQNACYPNGEDESAEIGEGTGTVTFSDTHFLAYQP